MRQEDLKFEFKFKIPGAGVEIPTLEELVLFQERSLVLWSKEVESQKIVQHMKKNHKANNK